MFPFALVFSGYLSLHPSLVDQKVYMVLVTVLAYCNILIQKYSRRKHWPVSTLPRTMLFRPSSFWTKVLKFRFRFLSLYVHLSSFFYAISNDKHCSACHFLLRFLRYQIFLGKFWCLLMLLIAFNDIVYESILLPIPACAFFPAYLFLWVYS